MHKIKHLLALLCALSSSLSGFDQSALQSTPSTITGEAEPSSFVNHSIHAISGSFYDRSVDMVMPGAEPLHFIRYYNSQNSALFTSLARGMGSNFPTAVGGLQETDCQEIIAEEDGGSIVKYVAKEFERDMDFYLDPQIVHNGFTNGRAGALSGLENLKNNSYRLKTNSDYTSGHWTGYIADGSTRHYYKTYDTALAMNLKWEEKPNGNELYYDYTHKGLLKEIKAKNRRGKTLGWLYFDRSYEHITISSSNGKKCTYSLIFHHDKEGEKIPYIAKIRSNDVPDIDISYEKIHDNYLISKITKPDGRYLEVEYDSKGKVIAQKAPAGKDGKKETLYNLYYHPDDRYTSVHDANGGKTYYHYTSKKRLKNIEQFKNGKSYSSTRFFWGDREHISKGRRDTSNEGYLLAKAICDRKERALVAHAYAYDSHGNVVQEKLFGNLTGKDKESFSLSSDGTPSSHVEHYTKEYAYNSRNLKICETEDDGLTVGYQYDENKNLLLAKLSFDGDRLFLRERFEYDENGVLIKKIVDDGSSKNLDSLHDVTRQLITKITPVEPLENGSGQPKEITEYYLDLQTNKKRQISRHVFTYNTQGYVTKEQVYDANDDYQYSLYKEYDDKGRLIESTDAIGRITYFLYDDNNNKTYEHMKGSHFTVHYRYDKMNRLIEKVEKHADTQEYSTRYGYDTLGNLMWEEDEFENKTYYEYDDLRRRTKTILPSYKDSHPTIKKEYNELGDVIAENDENGNTTSYEYNSRHQPIKITYPDDSKEYFEYNKNGTLAFHWDKDNNKTAFTYDILDRITKTKIYNAKGDLLSSTKNEYSTFHLLKQTDAMGVETVFEYDDAGRLIQEKKGDKNCFHKTSYSYDTMGRVACKKEHSLDNALATYFTYDKLGRVIAQEEYSRDTLLSQETYSYDLLGNKTKTVTSIDSSAKAMTQTIYDTKNRPIELIDEEGNSTKIGYNIKHRNEEGKRVLQKTTLDPLGRKTEENYNTLQLVEEITITSEQGLLLAHTLLTYDKAGNKIKEEHDAIINGKKDHTYTITWKYDSMDREIEVCEAPNTIDEKRTLSSYDKAGRLKKLTKPDGITLTHCYDELGRLATLLSSDNTISYTYEYDKNNNLIRIHDRVLQKVFNKSYDLLSRLTAETFLNNQTVAYSYNPLDQLTRYTLPDSTSVEYSYKNTLLQTITRNSNTPYTHTYNTFNLRSEVLQSTLIGNSGMLNYSWDSKGRLVSILSPLFSEEIPENGFDKRGNLLTLTSQDPIGKSSSKYAYDSLSQLTEESGQFDQSFVNDSLANHIQKDGLLQQHDLTNRLLTGDKVFYLYDKNGNLVQKEEQGAKTLYRYDALNRLIEVKTGGMVANYSYDHTGKRLSKEILTWDKTSLSFIPALKRYYFYLFEREVGAQDEQGKIVEFRTLGLGKRAEIGASIAIEANNQILCPIHDHRGNIVLLANKDTGALVELRRYSAFGEKQIYNVNLQAISTPSIPWGFASKRFDEETGFFYFGKRYYSPTMCRWATPDPAGFIDGPNLYAYVKNSPLTLIDPYGLSAFDTIKETCTDYTTGFHEGHQTEVQKHDNFSDDKMNTISKPSMTAYSIGYETGRIVGRIDTHPLGDLLLAVVTDGMLAGNTVKLKNSIKLSKNVSPRLSQQPVTPKASTESTTKIGKNYSQKELANTTEKITAEILGKKPQRPSNTAQKTPKDLPDGHMWTKNSPFKNKTADELHDMFIKKGFRTRGPDPKIGKGSYLHPKSARQYGIDPLAEGRYREPNHIDVYRLDDYKGSLEKKRFRYSDD
jgi:RHS repeat-associated protein